MEEWSSSTMDPTALGETHGVTMEEWDPPPRQIALTPMTYSYCFQSARVLLLLLSWSWDHYSQESLDIKGVIVSILQVKMLKHRKAKKLPIGGSSWSDRVWCQPSRCVSDLCVISHRAVLCPSNGTGHRQRDSSGILVKQCSGLWKIRKNQVYNRILAT